MRKMTNTEALIENSSRPQNTVCKETIGAMGRSQKKVKVPFYINVIPFCCPLDLFSQSEGPYYLI